MNEKVQKVGFIGLGRMGKPMAINIVRAGFDLRVHDAREEPMREIVRLGAKAVQSPRAAAEAADVVALVVVDDAQVEDVLLGDRGALEGLTQGAIVVIHSTVLPKTVQ